MYDRTNYLNEPLLIEKELKKLFPADASLVIADIGACEGEDSIRYARLFPNAQIYAFEPLPFNCGIIKSNFEKYHIANARLIEKALSDKSGSFRLYVSSGNPVEAANEDWDYGNKSSSLLKPAKHLEVSDFISFDQTISINTITLDEFCKEQQLRGFDLLHLDVQGAELMVLHGASSTLRFIKAIWLEVSTTDLYKEQPLADDIEKFMNDNGFVMVRDCLYGISGERLYISRFFFPKYRRLFPAWTRKRSLLRKVLRKAGF